MSFNSVSVENIALHHLTTDLREIKRQAVFKTPTVWNLPDNSLTEQSDSVETHSSNNDIVLSDDTPTDQSEAFICGEKQEAGVADAALQDGEKGAGTAANF